MANKKTPTNATTVERNDPYKMRSLEQILALFDGGEFLTEIMDGHKKLQIDLLDQGWDLGELYDKDINDLKFGAKPLYKATKIKIGKNRGDGYVVPSFIGTTEAIERDRPDVFDALLGALE
jgi:hypothetical protein